MVEWWKGNRFEFVFGFSERVLDYIVIEKRDVRERISRVLLFQRVIHLGGMLPYCSLQPTFFYGCKYIPLSCVMACRVLGFAFNGVYHAFFVTKKAVRSYRTFSPLLFCI